VPAVEFVGPDLGRVTTETIFEPRLGDLPDSYATRDAASTRSRSRNSPPPSIKAEGWIHQLLLRPIVPPPLQRSRGLDRRPRRSSFGHRRLRGAAIAGLAIAPCMVRAMTDEEARRAQIAENLQGADMHPIEEAEGFQALIDRHRESADSIAEQVGNTAATSTAASSSWRRTT
jgi:hypothetical protein